MSATKTRITYVQRGIGTSGEKDDAVVKLVVQCRTKRKLHPDDPMVTMNCLLAADDDDAVRACVAAAERLYVAPP